MKKMLSMLRGILLALCCLLGKQVIALLGINGSSAIIYAGAGIPIMNNGQTNNFRFIVSNPTVSPISGISVQTVIPAGCTVCIVAPPSCTTYNSGTGI